MSAVLIILSESISMVFVHIIFQGSVKIEDFSHIAWEKYYLEKNNQK